MNISRALRRFLLGVILLSMSKLEAGALRTPTDAPRRDAKIRFATVDMARVLREWEAVQAAQKRTTGCGELQQEPDVRQKKLKNMNRLIDGEKNSETREKLVKARKALLDSMQSEFEQLKKKLQRKEEDQFEVLKGRIYSAIDKIAAEGQLEMVVEKQWVYFPRRTLDITDELLRRLRAEYPPTRPESMRKQQWMPDTEEE